MRDLSKIFYLQEDRDRVFLESFGQFTGVPTMVFSRVRGPIHKGTCCMYLAPQIIPVVFTSQVANLTCEKS